MPRSLARLSLLLLLAAFPARAHDVMGTVVFVDLGHTRAHLQVELPLDELTAALEGHAVQPGLATLPRAPEALAAYTLDHTSVSTPEGARFTLHARPGALTQHDHRTWLQVELDATPPPGASARDFVLTTDVIDHQVVSHHVFVFLRRDVESGQLDAPAYLDTLHWQHTSTHIAREGSLATGFRAAFSLGLSHIASGTDHLVFLFTLLLPAGLLVGRRRWTTPGPWRHTLLAVLKVVTAFTLGHSVTLLLGALGLARLPSALVESLIALSIVVTAVHAMVPLFPSREAWVALGFGLVHGLGFASALEGLGVDGSSLAVTVLGFNLGVEVMQALLVAAALPSLLVLQRTSAAFRLTGAFAALALGLAWLGQRAFDLPLPGLSSLDGLGPRLPLVLLGLAALALLARARRFPSPA